MSLVCLGPKVFAQRNLPLPPTPRDKKYMNGTVAPSNNTHTSVKVRVLKELSTTKLDRMMSEPTYYVVMCEEVHEKFLGVVLTISVEHYRKAWENAITFHEEDTHRLMLRDMYQNLMSRDDVHELSPLALDFFVKNAVKFYFLRKKWFGTNPPIMDYAYLHGSRAHPRRFISESGAQGIFKRPTSLRLFPYV
jgi:hypothetical protein